MQWNGYGKLPIISPLLPGGQIGPAGAFEQKLTVSPSRIHMKLAHCGNADVARRACRGRQRGPRCDGLRLRPSPFASPRLSWVSLPPIYLPVKKIARLMQKSTRKLIQKIKTRLNSSILLFWRCLLLIYEVILTVPQRYLYHHTYPGIHQTERD